MNRGCLMSTINSWQEKDEKIGLEILPQLRLNLGISDATIKATVFFLIHNKEYSFQFIHACHLI